MTSVQQKTERTEGDRVLELTNQRVHDRVQLSFCFRGAQLVGVEKCKTWECIPHAIDVSAEQRERGDERRVDVS
jgi:hypothetical protein